MKTIFKRYQKFPLYTLPHTVLALCSRECVTIIMIAFGEPVAAGFFALVRSVLLIPSSFILQTVGQIFYREASQSLDRPEFRLFSFDLMLAIACVMAPGCMYIANWGPDIFTFVFGKLWTQAGIYAMVYMPVALLFILSIWCGKVFEIRNKQDIVFRIQLVFDTLSIATLASLLAYTNNPIESLIGYVAVQIVYLLVYLGFVFDLLHLSKSKYLLLIAAASGCAGAQELIHILLGIIENGTWFHMALETAVITLTTAGSGLFFWRLLKRSPVMQLASEAV